jgi:hypothetical protein
MAVKSAIIQKPETLVPENIAEGVDIAGIVGTLAATDGAKIAMGTLESQATNITVTHNLGVIPDIAIFVTPNTNTQKQACFIFHVSSNFKSKYGFPYSLI